MTSSLPSGLKEKGIEKIEINGTGDINVLGWF